MLRQPSIPRREARSVSPRRRTGRPDDSSTWIRPLTTPTSSAPLWAKGASTVADRVVRGDLTAEQLVEGDVEAPGKGHQRLEGEPSFSPLHLGDSAWGDPGEAGEIALAQIPAQAVGAQRRADARRRLGRLQLQPSVLDGVAEQLALGSRRAPLGLADAQAALADDD